MAESKNPADLRVAIIFLRAVREWDQGELAAASGVSASTISRYESGEAAPTLKSFEQIVDAVGVPASTLARLFAVIRSARAAVRYTGWSEQAGDVDAIAAQFSDHMFDIARDAASMLLERLSTHRQEAAEAERPPCEEDRRPAPSLWARLARHDTETRRVLVEEGREYQSWAVCEQAAAASREATNPREALELAELALLIAELAPGQPSWRSRLEGYALAHVSRARRACGDLAGAGQAFTRARELWEAGAPGDPGLLDEAVVRELGAA
jgi:transcriptional regulator with XRE-family HTH domain